MTEPVSITSNAFAVLEVLGKQSGPITLKACIALLPPEAQKHATSGMIGLLKRKAIKSDGVKPSQLAKYTITPYGKSILKLPNDLLLIQPPKLDQSGRAAANKNKKTEAKTAPAPALNLSKSTNAAVDVLSAVINENHELRELMTRICGQIAGALGLQIIKPQGE